MRPRMVDVARRAGVSTKTVSNVINGYVHVSPEMRTRVQRAVEDLGYVPNSTARTLRTGRTGVIAFAVPNLAGAYFAELATLITVAAEKRGFTILIDQTDGLLEREQRIAAGLRDHVIDGLVFSPLTMTVPEISAASGSTPMVLLGERDTPSTVDHVVIDNVVAAREATEHLVSLGRRRIAAVGAPLDVFTGTGSVRLRGYREALENAGLEDSALVVPTGRLLRRHGAEAADRLLDLPRPPDALFCFNDAIAFGVMHALRRRGVRVPADIAVVGFDDVEEASYSNPTLTSVRPDKQGIAEAAIERLVSRLDGTTAHRPDAVVIPHELVVRESSGGSG